MALSLCSRLAGPGGGALLHVQLCRRFSTSRSRLSPPILAMPRRRKNKGSSENPDLEPIQPWEKPDAVVSRSEPKPKPLPAPVPSAVALEPEAVVIAAAPAPPRAPSPTANGHGKVADIDGPSSISGETSERDIDALGRQLTKILRHSALDFRLAIRSDGYVEVADLLKLDVTTRTRRKLSSHSVDDVRLAAARDLKQRMGLLEENGKTFIRANQGHSMKVIVSEQLLKPVVDAGEVAVCVHGTYLQNLKSIFAKGLCKMSRLHIHFATGLPNESGVISGMRASCEVLIHLNVEKALADGMKLFKSENGVILTEGFGGVVPKEYFSRVESLPGRKQIQIPAKVVQ